MEGLAVGANYKDRVAALIMNAGQRTGWDRDATRAMLRDWWDGGSYSPYFRRIERRDDGLDPDAYTAKRRDEINARYDDLIARLPEHADEYEADRARELADATTPTATGAGRPTRNGRRVSSRPAPTAWTSTGSRSTTPTSRTGTSPTPGKWSLNATRSERPCSTGCSTGPTGAPPKPPPRWRPRRPNTRPGTVSGRSPTLPVRGGSRSPAPT